MTRKSKIKIGRFHPIVRDVAKALSFPEDGRLGTREAQKLVTAVFEAMAEALRNGESVTLPFGTLKVMPNNVKPYRRWLPALREDRNVGQPVGFYQKQHKVVLEPHY